jgi:hypothetical protein
MLQGSSNSRGRFTAASRAGACHSLELPNQQNMMLKRHGRREVSLVIKIFLAVVLHMKKWCLISYFC